ncbi:YoaK family protein [Chitinophaga vietnamensis]|uniref:YoaK family protein n=1 Tax=Chitinophaga vietnamensis TaxID=2593957 RepID=UPI00117876D8|nr:YoaK family protein [Chitinophaga vietnamensis]
MLRHTGKKRSYRHNLRLAVLLCFTAGVVNAAALFAFSVLTTNVTGHAALLAHRLATGDFRAARMVALWLLLFLAGAFFSALFTMHRSKWRHVIPVVLEIIILVTIGYTGHTYKGTVAQTEYFAGSLLFAMGMQNALVSTVSGYVVRTTHLTGMFTDLGIDLCHALADERKPDLRRRIILRLVIIVFFLAGGIVGGYAFLRYQYNTFYLPAAILVVALYYDVWRIRFARMMRRLRMQHYL